MIIVSAGTVYCVGEWSPGQAMIHHQEYQKSDSYG